MSIDPLRQLCLERGFFLRREAVSHDVDDGALRRGLRSGHLVRVRHGAYTFGDLWAAASATERHVVVAGAVSLVHPDRVALTHHSAVAMRDSTPGGCRCTRSTSPAWTAAREGQPATSCTTWAGWPSLTS